MLIFSPIMLCCSAQNFDLLCSCMLKILTVLLEYIHKVIDVVTVLLEYIKFNNNCGECSIRVYRSLLIFLTKHFLLCWYYA